MLLERCGGSGKVMYEGAVHVMAKGAGWAACGGVVMVRQREEGLESPGVLPEWEEVVDGDVNKDTMQIGGHGGESVA